MSARNGSEIKLKTELDEILGQAMQERKEIAGMQLLEIPFSGMHRLPQWRTSELLKRRLADQSTIEKIPQAILNSYLLGSSGDKNHEVSSTT